MKNVIVLTGLIVFCFTCCSSESNVRMPAVAGQFYPGSPDELRSSVDSFLKNVPLQKIQGRPVAFIMPHAGYVFSAQTAAYGYSLLSDRAGVTVVLIGNSHHVHLTQAAFYAKGVFRTPLGDIEIDEELARRIISKTNLAAENTSPHGPEHSLEVQLPFLQRKLTGFKIVPILLSNSTLENCRELGEAIAASLKESGRSGSAVIIASSDMSHYPSWNNANMADNSALKSLEKFDPPALQKSISGIMSSRIPDLSCVFCGEESVYTAMYAARSLGADRISILKYTNSGDVSGDRSRVVGYTSAVITAPESSGKNGKTTIPAKEKTMSEFSLTPEAQTSLLTIARQSIEQYLKNGKLPELRVSEKELLEPAAVFVTLTMNGNLRGCIGTTAPQAALYKAVSQMAVSAATEDYRFTPVRAGDLKNIRIEISVLSPMKRVKSGGEIRENIDGVVVRKGGGGGLFLPQVWEHFDNKEDFMGELCSQKAGLSRDAWKDPGAELYTFTVFAFEEH